MSLFLTRLREGLRLNAKLLFICYLLFNAITWKHSFILGLSWRLKNTLILNNEIWVKTLPIEQYQVISTNKMLNKKDTIFLEAYRVECNPCQYCTM